MRQPEAVRERIIRAAKGAFAERGYTGASLRTIATAADVSLPLLVYHFGNKEGLWRSVIDTVASGRFNAVEHSHRGTIDDPVVGLRTYIAHTVRRYASEPSLNLLLLQEAGHSSDRLRWMVETHMRSEYEEAQSLILECQSLGAVNPLLSPERLLFAIFSLSAAPFSYSAQFELLTGLRVFEEAEIDQTITFVETLVFGSFIASPGTANSIQKNVRG